MTVVDLPPLDRDLEQLIRDHVGLAHHVARRHHAPHPYDHDDLFDIALTELIFIARDWDPVKGTTTTFAKYAATRMHQRVIDWIRANSWGWTRCRGRVHQVPASLDAPVKAPGAENTDHHEIIQSHEADFSDLERDDVLEACSPRERRIVLLLEAGYNMREVGEELGVTESRISQLVAQVRWRLQTRGLAA